MALARAERLAKLAPSRPLTRRASSVTGWTRPRRRRRRRGEEVANCRIAALQRNKPFQARYRAAFAARRRGELDVQFPFGTYHLRITGLVRVEPPPA